MGHERTYYPGCVNFRAADVIIINKANTAEPVHVSLRIDSLSAGLLYAWLKQGSPSQQSLLTEPLSKTSVSSMRMSIR